MYRTSVYIRTDITGYQPAPGDLAYPEKLEMMESIAEQLNQQQQVIVIEVLAPSANPFRSSTMIGVSIM